VKNYRYLTHGNVSVAGQDDAELYRQLVEAMEIMGFTKDEQDGMLSWFSHPCVGPGHPSSPLYIFYFIICSFPFSFLLLALLVFFFCQSVPFLPE